MAYNTPFDNAYKTLTTKYPRLIIPLINKFFGEQFDENEPIEILSADLPKQDSEIFADSIYKICNKMYHVECQSNPDGMIAVRILEYDFYIAMRNVVKDKSGKLHVRFPKSCVLYLRHNENTPDSAKVTVHISDSASFDYEVPIIKTQPIELDEIFNENMYILLPFYILRYEKELDILENDSSKLKNVVNEYKTIIDRLDKIYLKERNTQIKLLILEVESQMKKLVDYLLQDEKISKNEIGGTIMGGTVMQTIGERIEELENTLADKEKELEQALAENAKKDAEIAKWKALANNQSK